MAKLFVIAGHGAGDPGACGNGYQEAERVRALAKRIKEFGGNSVMLGDTNRNYYADNGISCLTIPKDYQIIELHMDSAIPSAKGAHVIIKAGFKPDAYDTALADFLTGVFPGRSNKIVERNNLANVNRAAAKGYGYRLVECGFISNSGDVEIFNSRMDEIAKGILKSFNIGATTTQSTTPNNPSNSSSHKYKIGDNVIFSTCYKSSTDPNSAAISASKMSKKHGIITKIYPGTKNKYLLDNGMCFVNDGDIRGFYSGGSTTSKKSTTEIAKEVIAGKWGNGDARRKKLEEAGYNYNTVQKEVNRLL